MNKTKEKRLYDAPALRCVSLKMEAGIASPVGSLSDLGVNDLLDEEDN